MTGMLTESTTWGINVIVVNSPMCPPASVPSATIASAPRPSIRFANPVDATTGTTLIPALFHASIYFPGEPAPVVTTATSSSITTWAKSGVCGFINMMFTPNGLSVSDFAFRISSRNNSLSIEPAAINPRPPASETAEARLASATQAMPPCMIGYFIPNSSVSVVFI